MEQSNLKIEHDYAQEMIDITQGTEAENVVLPMFTVQTVNTTSLDTSDTRGSSVHGTASSSDNRGSTMHWTVASSTIIPHVAQEDSKEDNSEILDLDFQFVPLVAKSSPDMSKVQGLLDNRSSDSPPSCIHHNITKDSGDHCPPCVVTTPTDSTSTEAELLVGYNQEDNGIRDSSLPLIGIDILGGNTLSIGKPTSGKPYECNVCGSGFSRKVTLVAHQKKEHPVGLLLKCSCSKEFKSTEDLTGRNKNHKHKKAKKWVKPYQCTVCNDNSSTAAKAILPDQQHKFKKGFKGRICCKEFDERDEFTAHVQEPPGQSTSKQTSLYKCTVCKKKFLTANGRRTHMRSKHALPLTCHICGKVCDNLTKFKAHERLHSTGFTCTICNKSFTRLSLLSIHQRTHTGEKPYMCDACGYCCTTAGNLNMHLRIHTGEKPYKCTLCGKGFKQICLRDNHQRMHTGDKRYACSVCGKKFYQSSGLKAHHNMHTGEKPYKCDVCGKGFTAPGSVRIHKRVHTGEKPYECTVCGDKFNVSSNLKSHMRIHAAKKL